MPSVASTLLLNQTNSVGRKLTVANIRCTVMDHFNVQHKALKDKSKETAPGVPKLLPSTTVAKWNDVINVHASQFVWARKSNLSYIIREDEAVPSVASTLLLNQPHSVEAGSI